MSLAKVKRLEEKYKKLQDQSRPLCRDHGYGVSKSCCNKRFELGVELFRLRSKLVDQTGETEKQVFKRLGGLI